ncbi:MAG: hypothetical protein BTN85_0884 [Candidatus Methanohalarchaeum thermophilum]|uniref:DUF2099 family protein n=1 Tax=Methanohalarchaeum thermophilum TaxID=1903181 RepID=A0A1Q6DVL6_METT1|nr:MAG: hypothetical protein BTN85_0884 [Candidatus Methanohalarchaeum thermophilum]
MGQNKHVLELLGRTKVILRDGKIESIDEPIIDFCPLMKKMKGVDSIKGMAEKQIETCKREFGFCTPNREFNEKDVVDFGISETLKVALEEDMLDAAVIVCEGSGTVITSNPGLVQGIGGRLSGIVEISPIKKIIEKIKEKNGYVLEPPRISQIDGYKKAKKMGFDRIAVTISSKKDIKRFRGFKDDEDLTLIGVHLTGLDNEKIERLVSMVDIATACASKKIRELSKEKANLQAGSSIPVYSYTQRGRDLILERAKSIDEKLKINVADLPELDEENQPRPLI